MERDIEILDTQSQRESEKEREYVFRKKEEESIMKRTLKHIFICFQMLLMFKGYGLKKKSGNFVYRMRITVLRSLKSFDKLAVELRIDSQMDKQIKQMIERYIDMDSGLVEQKETKIKL